jgi:hypothetical protein
MTEGGAALPAARDPSMAMPGPADGRLVAPGLVGQVMRSLAWPARLLGLRIGSRAADGAPEPRPFVDTQATWKDLSSDLVPQAESPASAA